MASYLITPGKSVGGYNPGVAVPAAAAAGHYANQQAQQLEDARNTNADLKAQGQQQIAQAQSQLSQAQSQAAMRVEQVRQQFENERAQAEQALAAWQSQLNASLENYRTSLAQAQRLTNNPYTYGPGGV